MNTKICYLYRDADNYRFIMSALSRGIIQGANPKVFLIAVTWVNILSKTGRDAGKEIR